MITEAVRGKYRRKSRENQGNVGEVSEVRERK